jgi:alkanesulfonate monooxygenase SsuD/methylene tetrahydromethanopterin reductase-like flavin-dependent oxidoreductase (luciferase family)
VDRVVPDVTPVRGRVPVLLGAMGPRALRLAGEVADGVILTSFASVPYVRWAVERVREGATAARRNPAEIEIAAIITTRLTDEPERALDELKPWCGLAYAMTGRGELLLTDSGIDPGVLEPVRAALRVDEIVAEGLEPYLHAFQRVRPEEVAQVVPAELVASAAMVGDAAAVRARLAEYVAAGVTQVIVDSPQPAGELLTALRG